MTHTVLAAAILLHDLAVDVAILAAWAVAMQVLIWIYLHHLDHRLEDLEQRLGKRR